MSHNTSKLYYNELSQLLESRISFYDDRSQVTISNREIDSVISMKNKIFVVPGQYIKNIYFRDCIFNDIIDIGELQNAGYVYFENCIFNHSVSIYYGNTFFQGESVFNHDLSFYINNEEEVNIADISILGTLKITGTVRSLQLSKINASKEINNQKILLSAYVTGMQITDVYADIIELQRHQYNGNLEIRNVKASKLLGISIELNSELRIQASEFDDIKFIKISGQERKVSLNGTKVNYLQIDLGIFERFSIFLCEIFSFVITKGNQPGNFMNIDKTRVNKLVFKEVINSGFITLREVSIPGNGSILFESSNLGKMDFIYCNFSEAKMHFENSKITEAFFSETEFPKRVFAAGEQNYSQAQLAFGQLATAFQKQGDSVRALEYGSRELEAHYRTIKWISPKFPQKLNLWLNHVSNDFGRNWLLGILFSIIVGIVFFCLLLVSVGELHIGILSNDAGIMPAFLKFMNPLRFYELDALFTNTSLNGKVKLNGISYLADFGGRLFLAYGYYQTIQAFRRFGKK